MRCDKCGQLLPEKNLEGFDAFWAVYPLKFGKLDAQKAWKGMNAVDRLSVMIDLNVVQRFLGVTKDSIPQPPYAATYLRKRRWEDPRPVSGIADPPKPKEPDGGIARRPVERLKTRAYGTPESFIQGTHDLMSPDEARTKLAQLMQGIGKKL